MKKVISITLNGLIFMIEEDALSVLSNYLDSIKKHYGADGGEIVNDIEANLAEKFKAISNGSEKAITIVDVDEIIGIMGTIEQMEVEDEKKDEQKNDKADEQAQPKSIKRLYRDETNSILGGVCTGLAAYFSIDVVIVRLIFVALTIMNGVGILIYIIMWMIVPVAKTSMQKLEMQGEPINLKNIEEVVKEKSEMIKEQSKKAFVSLKEQKSVFAKILSIPIILIEAAIKFVQAIWNALLPIARIVIGLAMIIGVFFTFVFSSFWTAILLFKTNSPFWKTDFPIEQIAHTKAYFVTISSLYFSGLIFIIIGLILAVSILGKKRIMNWTIAIVLFALLAINATVASIYGFELASNCKTVYEKYISDNTIEKNIEIDNFNGISGDISARITVEKADKLSVLITGLKNDVEGVEFIKTASSSDGVVSLHLKDNNRSRHHGSFNISKRVNITIKMPELKEFDATNLYDYEITGFGDTKKIIIDREADENRDFELEFDQQ